MLALRMLALLAGLGAASASNSDVCTTASAYDGTASSSISGCSVAGSCDSSGYWICDDVVTMMTNVYAPKSSARVLHFTRGVNPRGRVSISALEIHRVHRSRGRRT